LQEIQKYKG